MHVPKSYWPPTKRYSNFGRVDLSVCLSDDNFRQPWRRKFIFCTPGISRGNMGQVRIWRSSVKVKVTEANKFENPHFRRVKLRSAIVRLKFACSMGFLDTADRMVWPPSLSRDRKWPRVTKCMHSRVVSLRLEGNLVFVYLTLIAVLSPQPFPSPLFATPTNVKWYTCVLLRLIDRKHGNTQGTGRGRCAVYWRWSGNHVRHGLRDQLHEHSNTRRQGATQLF